MEFRSTLQKHVEDASDRIKQARENGYKTSPLLLELFHKIKDTPPFLAARLRTIMIAREIQPSIMKEDLRIASDMQLAMATELILNLVKEGLISVNR